MKTKMNFYCVLMLAVFLADFASALFMAGTGFVNGWEGVTTDVVSDAEIRIAETWWWVLLPAAALMCFFAVKVLVRFVKFVLNVNRNEVFSLRNVAHLRWVGAGCLVVAVCSILMSLPTASQLLPVIEGRIDTIIFGIFALIMSEAFAIGLRLREEQELTV